MDKRNIATYNCLSQNMTSDEQEKEHRRIRKMITIECTLDEEKERKDFIEEIKAGKYKKPVVQSSVKDPVVFYGLTVKANMKFRGNDARTARRWLYDLLRKFEALYAGFDGPRDPIVMSFYCRSGREIADLLELMLPNQNYNDLEIRLDYRCSKDPEHCGTFKIGKRKKGLTRLLDFTKETENGQMKLS